MSVKNNVSIQETVDFLNNLLKIDPTAINNLFSIRVGCNKVMADHKTVQVVGLSDSYFIVGLIGILNGLFGIDKHGWGHIAIDCDESNIITKFRVLSDQDVKKYAGKEFEKETEK